MSNTSTKPKKSNWRFKTLRLRDLKKLQITNELDHIIREFSNQLETSNESLILPGLWLGNKYTAKDIDFVTNNKIKYIINITDDINNEFDFISYTNFKIRDIMACENSRKETEIDTLGILRRGSEIINTALGNNMSVLVHCKRGHHRSASIIAFYLMKYHDEKSKYTNELVELLYDGLKNIPQVVLYGDFKERTPILAFNIQGMDSFQAADLLNNKYDIAVRCGTHCAPLMHQHLDTVKSGIVRVSLSFMNTKEEIQFFIKAIQEISEGNYDN